MIRTERILLTTAGSYSWFGISSLVQLLSCRGETGRKQALRFPPNLQSSHTRRTTFFLPSSFNSPPHHPPTLGHSQEGNWAINIYKRQGCPVVEKVKTNTPSLQNVPDASLPASTSPFPQAWAVGGWCQESSPPPSESAP